MKKILKYKEKQNKAFYLSKRNENLTCEKVSLDQKIDYLKNKIEQITIIGHNFEFIIEKQLWDSKKKKENNINMYKPKSVSNTLNYNDSSHLRIIFLIQNR